MSLEGVPCSLFLYGLERGNGMFFRKMTEEELVNMRKAIKPGFFTYMLLLFLDYSYSFMTGNELFTSFVIFWAGLLVFFGYEFILNVKSKRQANQ